jgi:hypothetical protein
VAAVAVSVASGAEASVASAACGQSLPGMVVAAAAWDLTIRHPRVVLRAGGEDLHDAIDHGVVGEPLANFPLIGRSARV